MAARRGIHPFGLFRSRTSARLQPFPITRARWRPYIVSLTIAGGTVSVLAYYSGNVDHPFERLKQRYILHADSAAHPDRPPSSTDKVFREDPDTSTPFPISLSLLTRIPPLTLVGLGVRKVSFLRVKVYSAGFYLEDDMLDNLESLAGWKSFSAQDLLTPLSATTNGPVGTPKMTGEALMRVLLDKPVTCAVRIVPVRNTDFGHLRDGFTRALIARQKIARTNGELKEDDETVRKAHLPTIVNDLRKQRIADSLQALKGLFPAQSVPKGQSLVLLRTSQGSLVVEYEGKILGEIRDNWVAREMMLTYFADKDVISPKLKEDVAKGLEGFVMR